MPYVITTDSCSDLSTQYMKERNLSVLPLIFTIDGGDHFDDKSMSSKTFFDMVRSGKMSQTTLINATRFEEFFSKFLEQGTDIIHISLSSELSGSHQNALIAMETLKDKYPDRKMTAIDSRTVSLGEGLLVHMALNKQQEGSNYKEITDFLESVKLNICAWFTVDDLNHLFRGGRLKKSAAVLGTLLSVKPILHINNEGKLVPHSKAKGRKKSIKALVDEMEKSAIDPKNNTIFISHGDCPEEAQALSDMIKEKFGSKDVFFDTIGPVVGAHGGPGTLAVFFLGTTREPA